MAKNKLFGLLIALVGLYLSGCNKDDENVGSQYKSVTSWMYHEMDYWYFWTHEMPTQPDFNLAPADFYKSLLSTKDRFSFYSENYEDLLNRLKGVSLESGFEYKLYLEEEGSENVIMQVSYVKSGSPADELGMRRGDIINSINDTRITKSNYRTLLAEMNENYTAAFKRYNPETESFDEPIQVAIQPTTYAENPIFLDSVYEVEGQKIGYLVYNFFAPGPSSQSKQYDDQLEEVFLNFKSQGIDEFILDLRYNSGGSETSAVNLASLMVKNADAGDLMFKKTYNPQVEEAIENDKDLGSEFLNVRFSSEAGNIGQTIKSGTVHVITSARSASASEVVINSLKPYMNVKLIGDVTVGKDAGSITLYEDDNPDNLWAIQPIIVKLVNSAGEDYPNGFTPDVEKVEDFLVLQPLGSIDEPLLSIALALASGGQPARVDLAEYGSHYQELGRKEIFSSVDHKAYSGKFLLNK